MGNIMNEIADVLQGLADQLGTSVEYLWPIMVDAYRADAIASLVVSVVVALTSAGFLPGVWRLLVRALDTRDKLNDFDIPIMLFFVLYVSGAIGSAAVLLRNMSFLSRIFYPEAHVIYQILDSIG